MVSRRLDPRVLLQGLAPGRLALAVLCVLLLVGTPERADQPLLTWTVVAPLGLLLWYGALSCLATLRATVRSDAGLRGAHLMIGMGACWVLALLAPGLWVYALPAVAAAAYGIAGAVSTR